MAVFCAGLLVLAGCGGDDDADRPQPTTTTVSTTTTSPEEADEQALRQLAEDWYATYNSIFEARGSAAEARDFLGDPYLSEFEAQVADYLESGNQTQLSSRSSQLIEDVEVDQDRAVLTECLVNANTLVGPDGEVLNDEVGARRIETVAVRTSDGWRFTERRSLGDVEEAACG